MLLVTLAISFRWQPHRLDIMLMNDDFSDESSTAAILLFYSTVIVLL